VTRDIAALALLLTAFSVLATAHVTLAIGLARRRPRTRALLALALPPLAPWWGWKAGMTVRSASWVVAAVAYAIVYLWQLHLPSTISPGEW
jgi:hypothetical protein